MRTTIRLDDPLLREAKARAAHAGVSLNTFIEDAVRSALRQEPAPLSYAPTAGFPDRVREASPAWPEVSGVAVEAKPGDRLRRVLEREIWPAVPSTQLGTTLTKPEVESILGYGEYGV